ncbi:MAG: type II toxin-antitoxin system HipA family toxin [Flavobacteriia bacterium]|nr:type II toxin-antitoxin system HipA family toxin [Flavobacteriia bacterium]
MSSIKVKIWDETIGYLYWDGVNNRSIFELDSDYQESNLNISPLLINKKIKIHTATTYEPIFQGLPPSIADSLPDYFGNRVFQTWLNQNNILESELNPIERLMYTGKRGIGAMEYEPGKSIINTIDTVDFGEIVEISEKIISNKYAFSDFINNQQALQNILTIGSSVGGAQAKILVAVHPKTGEIKAGDVLHEDKEFDYFIVKLGHESESVWGKEKTSVEYVYYLMAKNAGLTINDSKLIENQGNIHFQTKRFDRVKGEKIHFQTLLAITGYSSKTSVFNYEQCFVVLEQMKFKHLDKEMLFRQMVFNIASCNMDDHLKNLGFILNREGNWSLSPSYDLTYPFDPFLPSLKFHKMNINGKSKDIEREDILKMAQKVGIRNPHGIIEEVKNAVSEFEQLAKNYEIGNYSRKTISTDIQKAINRI